MRLLSILLIGGLATGVVSLPAHADDATPTATIVIERFAFEPAEIAIKAGTKVAFVNKDQMPHGVVGEGAGGELFRSEDQIEEGGTFSVTLTKPGEIAVSCGLHANMKGRITVTQ